MYPDLRISFLENERKILSKKIICCVSLHYWFKLMVELSMTVVFKPWVETKNGSPGWFKEKFEKKAGLPLEIAMIDKVIIKIMKGTLSLSFYLKRRKKLKNHCSDCTDWPEKNSWQLSLMILWKHIPDLIVHDSSVYIIPVSLLWKCDLWPLTANLTETLFSFNQ